MGQAVLVRVAEHLVKVAVLEQQVKEIKVVVEQTAEL